MLIFTEKDFLPYMTDVCKYNEELTALDEKWENIKLLCEMNCPQQSQTIIPQMAKIQKNFSSLQKGLVESLVEEELNKVKQKIIPQAQAAIDILVRNLYERTADIGFLATDGDIRRFTALGGRATEADRETVLKRLNEYVSKYSVYNEVIILDKNFKVLANLDNENPITGKTIDDPLLHETVESDSKFVETFRKSPLQTRRERAHIFSGKITDEDTGEIIGVICLCFRFINETKAIFKKLVNPDDGLFLSIVDTNNIVIASSDESYLPVGTEAETDESGKENIVYYRGLEYYVKTLPAAEYQGYKGIGWKAHVMVPLGIAFKEKAGDTLDKIDPEVKSGLMGKSDSFSEKLNSIMTQTGKINRSLKSIVFNGQLITKGNSNNSEFTPLRPLLHYMNRMGSDISHVFEDSVKNLFAAVISSSLQDSVFLSSFCIDVMDRNLYERADDCRWWALNPTFRKILSVGGISDGDKNKLCEKLTYINSLYTIYSSLFLFDRSGRIVAVSNQGEKSQIGSKANKPFIKRILENNDESKYFVSPFERSPLYGGQYTYIYGASVTDPVNPTKTVGGIGIVFDSGFQFRSMLEESKPDSKGSFCVFTDRNANVISSTRDDMTAGTKLKLPKRFFETEKGKSVAEILVYENMYYTVGCSCSSSYREYKSTDGYENDVISFVFKAIAGCDGKAADNSYDLLVDQSDIVLSENDEHIKLVSFVSNGRLIAVKEEDVIESIDSGTIINIPESNELIRGAVVYKKRYVPVINTHMLFGCKEDGAIPPHLLIIRLSGDVLVAMEADQLNNVLEVNKSDIKMIPDVGKDKSIIKGVICFENAGKKLMLVLDHNLLPERMDKDLLNADFQNVLPFLEKAKEKKKNGKEK